MLRSVLRSSGTAKTLAQPLFFSTKNITKSKKGPKPDSKVNPSPLSSSSAAVVSDNLDDKDLRVRRLAEDEKDKSLDVGPNARPLFTSTDSLALLSLKDTCSYMKFSMDDLRMMLPEGLPVGMLKEFEESKRNALLIRQSFLDLRDNSGALSILPCNHLMEKVQRLKNKSFWTDLLAVVKVSLLRCLSSGLVKKVGWFFMYPKDETGLMEVFSTTNPKTGFWDTPVQAANALQDFLKFNESRLQQIPCQITDSISLGEGAGVGWMKGIDSMEIPEGSTLYDLIQIGIKSTNAAVGVLVRLRKELSLVKDVPVLFAIDQYNNWFTFTEYEEPVTVRSCKPIHAKEVATVSAFRSMMHNDMMVGAFSHSTAVGKLRQELPDVPVDARTNLSRYTLDEAAAVCHYYLRQRLVRREAFSDEGWKKIYFLANGNGAEMRWLFPFMR